MYSDQPLFVCWVRSSSRLPAGPRIAKWLLEGRSWGPNADVALILRVFCWVIQTSWRVKKTLTKKDPIAHIVQGSRTINIYIHLNKVGWTSHNEPLRSIELVVTFGVLQSVESGSLLLAHPSPIWWYIWYCNQTSLGIDHVEQSPGVPARSVGAVWQRDGKAWQSQSQEVFFVWGFDSTSSKCTRRWNRGSMVGCCCNHLL